MHHTFKRSSALGLVLASTLSGCHLGGQSFDDGVDGLDGIRARREHEAAKDAGSKESSTQEALSSSQETSSTVASSLVCGESGVPFVATTEAETLERLSGRWLLCNGGNQFEESYDGIDLYEDGTWSLLRADEEGVLQPQKGFDGEGSWEVQTQAPNDLDNPLVLLRQAVGGPSFTLSFQSDGAFMRLSNSDGEDEYRLESETVSPPAPSNTSDAGALPRGAEACGVDGDVVTTITTQEAFVDHLTGRWVYCSGFVHFAPHDGIEVREDGTWAFLRYDEEEELAVQNEPDLSGTWTVQENNPTYFQFDLETYAGSFMASYLGFQEEPSAMTVQSSGGKTIFARE